MRDVYAAAALLGRPGDTRADLGPVAAKEALGWAADKYDLPHPVDWEAGTMSIPGGAISWQLDAIPGDSRTLWRLEWSAEGEHGPSLTWQTRCQIARDEHEARFVVRIGIASAHTRIAPARYEVGRPNVLVRLAGNPGLQCDGRPLLDKPWLVASDDIPGLVDLLLHPVRRLPVVILTPSDDTGRPLVSGVRMADRLVGLAHVVEVRSKPATFGLTDQLGPALSVFGGAVRVYWPGLSRESFPYDHPLWLPERIAELEASPRDLIRRLEHLMSGIAVTRVGPEPLEAVLKTARDRAQMGQIESLESRLRELAATSNEPGEQWLEEFENTLQEMQSVKQALSTAQADNWALRDTIAQLEDQLTAVKRSFGQAAMAQLPVEPSADDEAAALFAVPEHARSSSEALSLAVQYLRNLTIPADAGRALGELDAAENGPAWGDTAWWALRALNAYVSQAATYSGFWNWCERSGNKSAWPASPKKLAMAESETVVNDPVLREKRRFTVEPAVDPSGTILMYTHIKVSEGGGQLAPRIYFHDDTKGATGKVHIGFFGPHRFVPNKGAN